MMDTFDSLDVTSPSTTDAASAQREHDAGRRRLIKAAAAGLGLAASGAQARPLAPRGDLPLPELSGIDHIVVVMMENRSFDHFLGWVPGADGVQAGQRFTSPAGATIDSFDLAPEFQGCAWADPAHGYSSGRKHVNGGAMDGFLKTQPEGDPFPVGYYTADSLPFYAGCASHWTICDRYFTGILASTWPNRIYMHCGQTDRINNDVRPCQLPTIWEALAQAGVEARYYFSDAPFSAIWGRKLVKFTRQVQEFHEAAASGNLPAVSFVDPRFLSEGGGTSGDDHPAADIRAGQWFLNGIYESLIRSPQWERTLMIINYDEWGGFADHVVPPMAAASPADLEAGNDGQLGIRVPCVLIGPRARRGAVFKEQLDPNSILNFISWRFRLPTLGVRSDSLNLAYALDLQTPRPLLFAPSFDVPPPPLVRACAFSDAPADRRIEVARRRQDHDAELAQLMQMARDSGYL